MRYTHPRLGYPELIPRKREMRKNPTRAEEILWRKLRSKRFNGFKFRRQHGIGPYIADFCSPRMGLVIEVDGDIHEHEEQKTIDKERQCEIESLGFRLVRYQNEEVIKNIEGVLEDLEKRLKTSP